MTHFSLSRYVELESLELLKSLVPEKGTRLFFVSVLELKECCLNRVFFYEPLIGFIKKPSACPFINPRFGKERDSEMFIHTPTQVLAAQPEAAHVESEILIHHRGRPEVVLLHPKPFFDALDAELPRQKRRFMKLRKDLAKAMTLLEKLDILKFISTAENTLRRMRLSLFDAQDAICECLMSDSTVAFESHAVLFPKVADLLKASCTKISQQ